MGTFSASRECYEKCYEFFSFIKRSVWWFRLELTKRHFSIINCHLVASACVGIDSTLCNHIEKWKWQHVHPHGDEENLVVCQFHLVVSLLGNFENCHNSKEDLPNQGDSSESLKLYCKILMMTTGQGGACWRKHKKGFLRGLEVAQRVPNTFWKLSRLKINAPRISLRVLQSCPNVSTPASHEGKHSCKQERVITQGLRETDPWVYTHFLQVFFDGHWLKIEHNLLCPRNVCWKGGNSRGKKMQNTLIHLST